MKDDFLDFTKEHKLSKTECELITQFRSLPKKQQELVFRVVFQLDSSKIETDENKK